MTGRGRASAHGGISDGGDSMADPRPRRGRCRPQVHRPPHAADARPGAPAARSPGRIPGRPEVRELRTHGRLQGPRRPPPRLDHARGRTPARGRGGFDREPRAIGRLRGPTLRRQGRDRDAREHGRSQGRRHPRPRRGSHPHRPRLRRGPKDGRIPRRERGLPLHSLRERAEAHRGRRDGHTRVTGNRPRHRAHLRPPGRGQRGPRRGDRRPRGQSGHPRDRRAGGRGTGDLPILGRETPDSHRPDHDLRRGPRHPGAVRPTAPVAAPPGRRDRPGLRHRPRGRHPPPLPHLAPRRRRRRRRRPRRRVGGTARTLLGEIAKFWHPFSFFSFFYFNLNYR